MTTKDKYIDRFNAEEIRKLLDNFCRQREVEVPSGQKIWIIYVTKFEDEETLYWIDTRFPDRCREDIPTDERSSIGRGIMNFCKARLETFQGSTHSVDLVKHGLTLSVEVESNQVTIVYKQDTEMGEVQGADSIINEWSVTDCMPEASVLADDEVAWTASKQTTNDADGDSDLQPPSTDGQAASVN